MARNIDVYFGHHFDSQRVNSAGLKAGTENFDIIAAIGSEEALGHLRAAGVAGA